MDELRIVKHTDHDFSIMQKESCLYKGSIHLNKNQQLLELRNVYDTVILTLATMKNSGFHLFRSNRDTATEIKDPQATGTLAAEGTCYIWSHIAEYRFYCSQKSNDLAFIMCDKNSVLGYMKKECGYVKALMYSSVFCAFWLWINQKVQQKGSIVYDEAQYQAFMEIES